MLAPTHSLKCSKCVYMAAGRCTTVLPSFRGVGSCCEHAAGGDHEQEASAANVGFSGLVATLDNQANPLFEPGMQDDRPSLSTNLLFELAEQQEDHEQSAPCVVSTLVIACEHVHMLCSLITA